MPTATPTAVAAAADAASPKPRDTGRGHPAAAAAAGTGRAGPREPARAPRRAPAPNPTPAPRRAPVPPPRNPLEPCLTPWFIAGGGGVRAGEARPRRRRSPPPRRRRSPPPRRLRGRPRPQVEVEYVPEKPDLGADDPLLLSVFAAVFEKFGLTDHTAAAPSSKEEGGWSVIQKGSNERGEKNGVEKEMEGERENNDTVEGIIEAEAGTFSEEMVTYRCKFLMELLVTLAQLEKQVHDNLANCKFLCMCGSATVK